MEQTSTRNIVMDSKEKALAGARAAYEAKAKDILVMWMESVTSISDCFVICTGTSLPHLRAVRDRIEKTLKEEHGLTCHGLTRSTESQWVALDYGDVIFHVFSEEKREFYALEELWSDAPRIPTGLPEE